MDDGRTSLGDPERRATPHMRRRRLRACDSCRQRKIRCDNLPGSCRNCQTYGGHCVITRDGRSIPRSNANSARVCINRLRLASEVSSLGPVSRSADSVHGVVTTEFGRSPKNSKFAGITSPQVFAKSVEELFRPVAPHLDVMAFFCPTMTFSEELPYWSPAQHPLVDKSIADLCLHQYFNTYHVLLPILDPRAFCDSYETFYQMGRAVEPAVVSGIFLVIALGCEDSEVADMHFRAVLDLVGELVARPYLPSVQAFILMSLYLINAGRESQAHLNIGLAARIAQSIGLHRSLSTHNHPHEFQFVLKEHNLRSCIWWACYCLDKKLSFELGRPSAIRDDDCDADMPDISQAFTPSSRVIVSSRVPDFFSSFIELSKHLSRISTDLFGISTPNADEKTLVTLMENADALLQDWRASFSSDFGSEDSCANSSITSIATGLLDSIYLNALVVVHRSSLICRNRSAYLVNHSNRRIAGSDKICLDAAHSLAHNINNLIAEQVSTMPKWTNPYAINTVMAICLSITQSPRKWTREIDLALLRSMRHCFRNREDTSLIGRFETFLESIIQAIEASESNCNGSGNSNGADSQTALPGTRTLTQAQINHSHSSSTKQWPQPPFPGDAITQRIEDDCPDQLVPAPVSVPVPRDSEFPLGELFGDQYNLWNFQLWPLAPLNENGNGNGNGLDMDAPLDVQRPP
ncbi:fungal-specific transcription factor domain-containing protein [Aspergillus unguis]